MKAEINLFECVSQHAKDKYKKSFVHMVQIGEIPQTGPFHKPFKTELGAQRYLIDLGFVTKDGVEWVIEKRSKELIFIEDHFKRA